MALAHSHSNRVSLRASRLSFRTHGQVNHQALPCKAARTICAPRRLQRGHAVYAAASESVSFKAAPKVQVGTEQASACPDLPGVYAVYSKDGALQYIGLSRKISGSVANHLQALPELVESVSFCTTDDASRENLTTLWKEWVEASVEQFGDIPPGNKPGEKKWQLRAKAPKPEIKLTAGKGITGVTIEDLVDQVVKTNKVVAFVKGTRLQPQCGFSHRVLTILNDVKAEYEVVNVLDEFYNPGLRDAIKTYSQWPTIPQLYIAGEFVGGADIVEQMFNAGELQQILKQ